MQSPSPAGESGVEPGAGLAISKVTYAEQIAEVERELRVRDRVYTRWVLQKKITAANAEKKQAGMRAVLETLKRASVELRELEPGKLHTGEVIGPAKVRADERAKVLAAVLHVTNSDVVYRTVAHLQKTEKA